MREDDWLTIDHPLTNTRAKSAKLSISLLSSRKVCRKCCWVVKRNLNQDEYDPIHSCLVTDIYIWRLYLMLLMSSQQWNECSDKTISVFTLQSRAAFLLSEDSYISHAATHLWTIFYFSSHPRLPLFTYPIVTSPQRIIAKASNNIAQATIRKLLDSLIRNSLKTVLHSVSTTMIATGFIGKWLLTCAARVIYESRKD